jgi:hypothetical protein
MGEGDQGREHQAELSGSKHSVPERCVVHYSKLRRSMSALGQKRTSRSRCLTLFMQLAAAH